MQHSRYHLILITPSLPDGFVDVTEIERITHPNSHFIARTDRQLKKAPEFRFRPLLTTVTFGNIRTDGLACSPHLIGQHMLFDLRKRQALTMNFERQPIRPLEDFQVFERNDSLAPLDVRPSSVVCLPSSES